MYKKYIGIGICSTFCYFQREKRENIVLKDDISSKTILSVSKKVSRHWDNNCIDVYKNEKKWLHRLNHSNITANPIHFDDKHRIITTEYSGEPITKENIPNDWKEQRNYILSVLKNNNCRHNDIKPSEILVLNNKIKLVDFGWASDLDKPNPKSFPKCLGAEFKCETDLCSFNKSIDYIMQKG